MSKLLARPLVALGAAALGIAAPALPAAAAILGPHAADCAVGSQHPAMLVRISGLKARTGTIRVQSYGGEPAGWFEKGRYLERVEVPASTTGPTEVCMPVPRNGSYAVSVRHDVNGSGKSDMADGGGFSGNPNLSLFDVLLKRRPSPVQVEVRVAGVVRVPVILNYVQGGSVKPIASAAR